MTKVMAPVAVVLAIGIAGPSGVRAQGGPLTKQASDAVRAAKNEVFVQLSSTPVEIHGRLTAFDATALTIQVDGRSFTFPTAEVLRVDTLGGFNRRKGVRGALIGGLAVGAWCAFICGQGLDSSDSVAAVALANGGLGATVGGLIGFMRDGHKTIYRSTGSGAAIARQPNELPCPATPLVVEAELTTTDVRRLQRTWTPVPESLVFGQSLCDGLAIQRRFNGTTAQPGVEMAAGAVSANWIDVRVRVTVRNSSALDKKAHVDIALRQDGRSQVTLVSSISADEGEEHSGDVTLRVPRALLAASASPFWLQVTLRTSYPH